jgi:hypothetical protein
VKWSAVGGSRSWKLRWLGGWMRSRERRRFEGQRVRRIEAEKSTRGMKLRVWYEAGGVAVGAERSVWVQVGHRYRVNPLRSDRNDTLRGRRNYVGRTGVLECLDQDAMTGGLRSDQTGRLMNVAIVDLESHEAAPQIFDRKVRRGPREVLSHARSTDRSDDKIATGKAENLESALAITNRRPARYRKHHPCNLCLERKISPRFLICFPCFEANGRPSRSKAAKLSREAWAKRRQKKS